MRLYGLDHHHQDNPMQGASALDIECFYMLAYIIERLETMATQAQIDKLKTDIVALIAAGVAEITAAVSTAQNASPDPAIDTLDTQVTAATQTLTDAAAKLVPPTA
jgi:hypothetical protein